MNKFFKLFTAFFIVFSFSFMPNFSQNNSVYAEENIQTVPVELWHAENSGKLSMGSKALDNTATVKDNGDGTITVTIKFKPMDFMEMHGHLISLSVYPKALFEGNLTKAEVISEYEDTNLDGAKAKFPGELKFTYSEKKPDKIGVRVNVDAMDKIMGGDAAQNAIIKFNWNDSKETKESTTTNTNSTSDKAPDGFVATKLEDYFKNEQKTKNKGLYTIDVTAAYLNPLTGITADGGTKNAAIGEGMSQGVISPVNSGGDLNEALNNQKTNGEKRWSKAMLQRTSDGKLYATVRIHLMNWITRSDEQGPFIKVLQQDGSFKQVQATETKSYIEKYKDSYADYRFEVPNENFLAMVQMFVEPMNRPVRFFVTANTETIKSGTDGVDMKAINDTNYGLYVMYGVLAIVVIGSVVFVIRKKGDK